MGWGGIENGQLLALAASKGFDALVSKDTKLPYERNVQNLPIAIVVLRAASNDLDDVRPLLPALLKMLSQLKPKQINYVP